MAPVTLAMTKRLELNPVSFLIVEAVASNIGGTATPVGDPPNIMTTSKTQLSYLDLPLVLGPIGLLIVWLILLHEW
jgi:Na+/H+ antiporter NhaD/arsenite permease-like protein